ncbi:MAG TPA: hypothetical protein VLE73_05745 [Candidatus Saccharimonadales bacterium]|nr:hypothetical protein [Candidatus Saccharimonadales bacterium]
MSEIIEVTRTETGAMVFLPDGHAGAIWNFDNDAAAPTCVSVSELYSHKRGQGVATRLIRSVVRFATEQHDTITTVESHVTVQGSLVAMHHVFENRLRIYEEDTPPRPESAITFDEALKVMDNWGAIPEDETERQHGLDVRASLAGLDMSAWEYPQELTLDLSTLDY